MEHAPVPSYTKNIIDDTLDPEDCDQEPELLKFVQVISSSNHKYPCIVTKSKPNLDEISRSELEALQVTAKKYGQFHPWKLREISHKEPCWVAASRSLPEGGHGRAPMPYESFFDGADANAQEIFQLM